MRHAAATIAILGSVVAAPAFGADGAALYAANCAKCHGKDGNADTPAAKAMKVPPLHAGQLSADALVSFLRGSDKHKAVASKLSDEEIGAIAGALPSGD